MPELQITLKAARTNKGYTLKEAAEHFDIHFSTLRKYEADSTNVPRSFFSKLESVYGIPVSFIYFGKEEDYHTVSIV
ncbi:MAG TPA: helix-turn-helix transcriptional regulator [Candidatus Saccharimonadales bacterium]|nr:helix-turn-helix transcriptional regulator [Candidatus Saccharimonadales bacterium]